MLHTPWGRIFGPYTERWSSQKMKIMNLEMARIGNGNEMAILQKTRIRSLFLKLHHKAERNGHMRPKNWCRKKMVTNDKRWPIHSHYMTKDSASGRLSAFLVNCCIGILARVSTPGCCMHLGVSILFLSLKISLKFYKIEEYLYF